MQGMPSEETSFFVYDVLMIKMEFKTNLNQFEASGGVAKVFKNMALDLRIDQQAFFLVGVQENPLTLDFYIEAFNLKQVKRVV